MQDIDLLNRNEKKYKETVNEQKINNKWYSLLFSLKDTIYSNKNKKQNNLKKGYMFQTNNKYNFIK